jgi:hypothetical protein
MADRVAQILEGAVDLHVHPAPSPLPRRIGAHEAAELAGEAGSQVESVVIDDDVAVPPRFLDRIVALCEAFGFDLAQPAQTLASHAAWRVVRRRPGALARETRFVEIGPVTAFRRPVAEALVPFPQLRYGWGLDLHWAALAADRGWHLGIVDALPVRHDAAPVGAAYAADAAIEEAQRFLAGRPYLSAAAVGDVLAVHR